MQTFNRICVKNHSVKDSEGNHFIAERGKEYLTGSEKDGFVTVFSSYWVKVPVDIFAGEIEFTHA